MPVLPLEILEQIIRSCSITARSAEPPDHVPPALQGVQQWRSTLAAICQTSKAFNLVGTPVLYHTLELVSLSTKCRHELLLTLYKSSKTATLVKELLLSQIEPIHFNDYHLDESRPLSPAYYDREQILLCAADDLLISDDLKADISEGIQEGSEDAEFALFLGLCKNLELLAFEVYVEDMDQSLALKVLDSVAKIDLLHLYELRVGYWDEPLASGSGHIDPFLGLQHLQVLDCWRLSFKNIYSLSYSTTSSTLSTLRVMDALIDDTGFSAILQICQNLKVLDLTFPPPEAGEYLRINHVAFGEALRKYGTGLRLLRFIDLNPFKLDFTVSMRPFGDLSELAALESLTVSRSALFGIDNRSISDVRKKDALPHKPVVTRHLTECLPVSLRSLTLRGTGRNNFFDEQEQLAGLQADARFSELNISDVDEL